MSAQLWLDPSIIQDEALFLSSYLHPGDFVVDVGANVGALTVIAAYLVGNRGRVVSLEPHPRIYRYLQHNIALNDLDNVTTYPAAAGSRREAGRISDLKSDDQNFISNDAGRHPVQILPLDEILPSMPISLIKIDVEGMELEVLEGAPQTIKRTACLYIECCDSTLQRFGHGIADLFHWLHSRRFTTWTVRNGVPSLATSDSVGEGLANIIALSPEAASRGPGMTGESSPRLRPSA